MDQIKISYITIYIPYSRKDVFEKLGKKEDTQFDVYV